MIEDRLANWGAVYRDRGHASTCRSFEGRYRSPQVWEPQAPRLTVDIHDAAVIEGAVSSLEIYPHTVLRAHYVLQWHPDRTMRAARKAAGQRCVKGEYESILAWCVGTLLRALELPAVVRKERARRRIKIALSC